jgi:hypothetical protein
MSSVLRKDIIATKLLSHISPIRIIQILLHLIDLRSLEMSDLLINISNKTHQVMTSNANRCEMLKGFLQCSMGSDFALVFKGSCHRSLVPEALKDKVYSIQLKIYSVFCTRTWNWGILCCKPNQKNTDHMHHQVINSLVVPAALSDHLTNQVR